MRDGEYHVIDAYDILSASMGDIEFEGVVLTGDVLVGCGAIKKFRIYETSYFISKLKFTYEHNELSAFVRFHYSGKVAYLQYVHQLQNLFHSLKGEELIITL